MTPSYVYAATVVSIYDGDTITLDVDLGFHIRARASFRLRGCNARELGQDGGVDARDHLRWLLPVGSQVVVASVKDDKYGGRYDATVQLPDGRDLVTELVAAGWAAAWDGTGTRPLPAWPRTETP